MYEFQMPALGADMEEGVVYDWRVRPGDPVRRGDIIASVETNKGLIDIEVFVDGVLQEILVGDGQIVPVGTVLAHIDTGELKVAAVADAATPIAEHHPMDHHSVTLPVEIEVQEEATADDSRRRVSPVARRLAAELNLDLAGITGSGPRGTVLRSDVERAAAVAAARKAPAPPVPMVPAAASAAAPPRAPADFQAGMRLAIARAMSLSNRDIPHYYLETQIDMSAALNWLEVENARRSVKERVLPAVLLIKGVARALTEVPELNGYWQDNTLQVQEGIHIGFAVALRQGGLVTPAIHHADLKNIDELMAALRDIITRTRSGRLRGSEMTDATITVTSLGDTGVERVYGVIYPPQVALVGFGTTSERVWVADGMIGVRPVITATLAGDHRASDGRRGAQFLAALNRSLQEPEKL